MGDKSTSALSKFNPFFEKLGLTGMFPGAPGGVNGQTAPAAPPKFQPPTVSTPGYSQPMQLFGGLSPENLTRYNTENGVSLPGKPPAFSTTTNKQGQTVAASDQQAFDEWKKANRGVA